MMRWAARPAAMIGLALVLLAGAALAVPGSQESVDVPPPRSVGAPDALGLAATGDLAAATVALEERLQRLPGDWQAWSSLGALHLQRASTTADPAFYERAEAAFAQSLQRHPDGNDAALVGQAALAASRHDFEEARSLAEQALVINAYSSSAYGVLTDALIELGDYDAAFRSLQRMLDLRPGVPAYTRASYSFELRGDIPAARDALEEALRIASDPSDIAFAHRYLGELAFGEGDLNEADRHFRAGQEAAPSYAPLLAGQARVAAARGDVDRALETWNTVVERFPDPGYLAELGDLYVSLDRQDEADLQYELIGVVEQLFLAAGADLDLEQAVFAADHGDPKRALEIAEETWRSRRSVHAADAYAWALHVNGRSHDALQLTEQAGRLGTRSAQFDYHRGMIQLAVGDRDGARRSLTDALELNPYFSVLHAPLAKAALMDLGGPVGQD